MHKNSLLTWGVLLSTLASSYATAAPNTEPGNAPRQNTRRASDANASPTYPTGSVVTPSERNDSGLYLGLTPGLGLVQGQSTVPKHYDKKSFGAKLTMGYQFTPMWQLEWGFLRFGEGKDKKPSLYTKTYRQESQGLFLGMVTAFGLGSSHVDLLLRYGVSYIQNRAYDFSKDGEDYEGGTDRAAGALLGLGARYRFGPTYSLGLDIDAGRETSMLIGLTNRWQF